MPQTVRECHEYYPQLLEIPKEHLRRLQARGEIDKKSEATEEILERRRRAYFDQTPRPVLHLLNDEQVNRLVILGDPGSGKSSLLQYMALQWARGADGAQRYTQRLPLVIELRDYDRWECPNGKSFVRYLHEGPTWHRFNQFDLDRHLRAPETMTLLLDGLDEVFDAARREQVMNDIHRLSLEYPSTRVIVTSRVIGYKSQRLADA